MKSNHKTRLLALATAIVGRKPRLIAPLIIMDSPLLPSTPEALIYHAHRMRRAIIRVKFGNGGNNMKVRDELTQNFGTGGPGASGDPDINNTTGVTVPRAIGLPSELPSLLQGENAGPPCNLPEQVSQKTILSENEGRGDNMWTGSRR